MATYWPIFLKFKDPVTRDFKGGLNGKGVLGPLSKMAGLSICRLFVNPTSIDVKKVASIATARTMGGNVFQPWPNQPDEISFDGIMYGLRAFQDFRVLSNVIDQSSPELKEVVLQYKWKEYRGYIKNVSVKARADNPRVFDYSLSFQSKDAFSLVRMMLGQITSYQAELDYFKQVYYGIKNAFVSDPLTAGLNVASFGVASIGASSVSAIDPTSQVDASSIVDASDNQMIMNRTGSIPGKLDLA